MLSSCANPSCSRKFRYLHEGKLFLLPTKSNDDVISNRVDFAGKLDHVHYAWLCDHCNQTFEVVLDTEGKVKVRARYDLSGIAVGLLGAVGVQIAFGTDVVCDLLALL